MFNKPFSKKTNDKLNFYWVFGIFLLFLRNEWLLLLLFFFLNYLFTQNKYRKKPQVNIFIKCFSLN